MQVAEDLASSWRLRTVDGRPVYSSEVERFCCRGLGEGRSRMVIIGMWSARGGHIAGTVSHQIMGLSRVLLHQTLSGLVQLLVCV